ncbi:MAG TPA: group 1 truncated hemoglobin [Bdellovibrionota bacterium]|nr:group 1 truncated hemoglobin [Bdellovibrionota bacterium]
MPRKPPPRVPAHRVADPFSLSKPELKKVFERAGGEAGLENILLDFYGRMSRDLLIGFFFIGKDVEAIARKQKDFLLRAFGARPSYSGKPPAEAHESLAPILSGHFDRRLQLLEETLRDHGLAAEDIRSWVGFENAFRGQIVAEPGR